jgi:hypothetical protein
MSKITTYLSILTLKVIGLNYPIKRNHLENWIKEEYPTICCPRRPTSLTETSTG